MNHRSPLSSRASRGPAVLFSPHLVFEARPPPFRHPERSRADSLFIPFPHATGRRSLSPSVSPSAVQGICGFPRRGSESYRYSPNAQFRWAEVKLEILGCARDDKGGEEWVQINAKRRDERIVDPSRPRSGYKGESSGSNQRQMRVERTADPSAALGMTKGESGGSTSTPNAG